MRYEFLTRIAVNERAIGVTRRSSGNAIAHETPQAASHADANPEDSPVARNVLTKDTRQVMTTETSNGVTNVP